MLLAFLPQVAVFVFAAGFHMPPAASASARISVFEHAVQQVQQQAIYAGVEHKPATPTERSSGVAQQHGTYADEDQDTKSPRYRLFVALSAMGYIQTNISPARFGYLRATGQQLPHDTESCLLTGAGLCGNQVQAFIEILRSLEVPARAVQVFYDSKHGPQGHVIAEVRWGGEWHMFDVTWGYVPLDAEPYDVMSFSERRERPAKVEWFNEGNPWRLKSTFTNTDPLEYLTADNANVLIDGSGVVRPPIVTQADNRLDFSFSHLPSHIGWSRQWSGNLGQVKMEIDVPDGFDQLSLKVAGDTCQIGCIEIDGELYAIDEILRVPVDEGPLTIAVGPNDWDCYVVIDSMSLRRSTSEQPESAEERIQID